MDLDAGYFMNLSDDAIPALEDTYHESEIAAEVKEKVGAALACIRQQRSLDQRERTWKSFHYARFRADRVLESMETELDRFKIKDGEVWPLIVIAPSGRELQCSSYYYD